MQVSVSKESNFESDLYIRKKKIHKKIIYILIFLIAVSSILFLISGVKESYFYYAMSQRIPKLIAIAITGGCIAVSSMIFQTITNNNILTPSILGLDSLYTLVQTMIVFFLGVKSSFVSNKSNNFLLSLTVMVIASFFIYKKLFDKSKNDIFFLLLIGMVFGTLFKSIGEFMQVVIDPNEYEALQNSLYASLGNINVKIILLSIIVIIAVIPFFYDYFKFLNVISLGKDQSINLGVNYDKIVKKMIILIAVLVSISTALVGPITFLGLIVTNVTRQLVKTFEHSYLIITSILVSILTMISGQFLVERVFTFNTTLSVIINFLGGIYFIYLLLKEGKE